MKSLSASCCPSRRSRWRGLLSRARRRLRLRRPEYDRHCDTVRGVGRAGNAQQKGIAGKAIDKVKEVAESADDILSRVPCRRRKAAPDRSDRCRMSRPNLLPGKPVVIVAFGSSSTQGFGSTSPEFTYPNRLAAELRRQYPRRRHHRAQSRQGRRRRARNDEAAADRGDRRQNPIW